MKNLSIKKCMKAKAILLKLTYIAMLYMTFGSISTKWANHK